MSSESKLVQQLCEQFCLKKHLRNYKKCQTKNIFTVGVVRGFFSPIPPPGRRGREPLSNKDYAQEVRERRIICPTLKPFIYSMKLSTLLTLLGDFEDNFLAQKILYAPIEEKLLTIGTKVSPKDTYRYLSSEDLASEGIIALLQAEKKELEKKPSWVWGKVYNAMRDAKKRGKSIDRLFRKDIKIVSIIKPSVSKIKTSLPSPRQQAIDNEEKALLEKHLTPRQLKIIKMKEEEKVISFREIGEAFGISKQAVHKEFTAIRETYKRVKKKT